MNISRIEPVGISTSISYISPVEKYRIIPAAEKAIREKRKREEDFLEREEIFKNLLPSWLGKKVNVLV